LPVSIIHINMVVKFSLITVVIPSHMKEESDKPDC